MQNKYFKVFFNIHFLCNVVLIVYIAFVIYQAKKYMYFAGFGSLFLLIFLLPYFWILFCIMIALLLFVKWKKRVLLSIALLLQMLCYLLWLFVMLHLFHSPIRWQELIMIVQIITTITLLCLIWEKV